MLWLSVIVDPKTTATTAQLFPPPRKPANARKD
jgi:hypothetical protein